MAFDRKRSAFLFSPYIENSVMKTEFSIDWGGRESFSWLTARGCHGPPRGQSFDSEPSPFAVPRSRRSDIAKKDSRPPFRPTPFPDPG